MDREGPVAKQRGINVTMSQMLSSTGQQIRCHMLLNIMLKVSITTSTPTPLAAKQDTHTSEVPNISALPTIYKSSSFTYTVRLKNSLQNACTPRSGDGIPRDKRIPEKVPVLQHSKH